MKQYLKLLALVLILVCVTFLAYLTLKPFARSFIVSISDIAQSYKEIAVSVSEVAGGASAYREYAPEPRASDLSPGQIMISGLKAEVVAVPYYPVRLLANIPNALEMRLGNTQEEMRLSEWVPYSSEIPWALRTGPRQRVVYAEFRGAGGEITSTSALAPDFNPTKGDRYVFPIAEAVFPDPFNNEAEYLWLQGFETNAAGWVSYDYNGGPHGNPNFFYPASWSQNGYIWTDHSRWRIDTPRDTTFYSCSADLPSLAPSRRIQRDRYSRDHDRSLT